MEDMALLKQTIFFKDLSRGELIKVNLLAERAAFKAGEEIVKEGTPCDALYIIKEGLVTVLKNGAHLDTLSIGEPIGEVSFIDKGLRSATLVASEDTVLMKLSADAFEKVMSRDKDLANKVYKSITVSLCDRLRKANEALKIIPDIAREPFNI
jgi:CRP-like cAMP-binding protein